MELAAAAARWRPQRVALSTSCARSMDKEEEREQVDAHRAVLAAATRVAWVAQHTRGACTIPICSPRLSPAETGAVAAASSKRNSALQPDNSM